MADPVPNTIVNGHAVDLQALNRGHNRRTRTIVRQLNSVQPSYKGNNQQINANQYALKSFQKVTKENQIMMDYTASSLGMAPNTKKPAQHAIKKKKIRKDL